MAKISSSIGSKEIAGQGMRKFTVDDPTMSDEDFDRGPDVNNPEGRMRRAHELASRQQESQGQQQRVPYDDHGRSLEDYSPEQITEMRRQKIDQLNRISQPARERIETLIGIGRASKNVEISSEDDSVTFSIRTLKGREIKALMRHAASLSNGTQSVTTAEASLSVRDVVLASSIYAIDGVSFDMFLNLNNRMDEDDKLAAKVVFLEDLDDSMISHLYNEYGELTKNNVGRFAVKNEADAKEVSESISKSGEGDRS